MKNRLNAPCLGFMIFLLLLVGNACSHKAAKNDTGTSKASTAEFKGDEPFFGEAKVKRYRLGNGLKVLILEDHSSPTFAYHTWFDVGSRDEQKGLTGLAHLFEHMMFKATANHPEGHFFKTLQRSGASNENAFTSKDYTAYVQSLPAQHLELIVSLESDRMVNLIVDENALNSEREVVQNERRMSRENSPEGMMFDTVFELAYPGHPYNWPVIGYAQDLENAKVKEVRDFYRNHYAPNNATVIVVGDVDPDRTVKLIEKYYGDLKAQPVRHYQGNDDLPKIAIHQKTLQLPIGIQKMFMGFPVPPLTHEDAPAIEILSTLLGHTHSARLYQALVDGGIASGVDSGHMGQKGPGLFYVIANMQQGKTAMQAIAIVDREIQKLIRDGVTPEELQAAKNQYRFELFSGLEGNFAKAQNMGYFEIVAGSMTVAPRLVAEVERLTPAQIQAAAKKYLNRNNRVVVTGLPKGKAQ